jgi:hypothetical protein
VFRNTSVSGNITTTSLASGINILTGDGSDCICMGDIDGDGKLDLIASNSNSGGDGNGNITVIKNTSVPGSISFQPFVQFGRTDRVSYCIATGDLDNDGKIDLISGNSDGTISILKNISSPGVINANSFAQHFEITINSSSLEIESVAIADLDNDSKPDIVVPGYVLKNISTNSVLIPTSFNNPISTSAGGYGMLMINDINGDGKPDILLGGNLYDYQLWAMQNMCTNATITANSFTASVGYATGIGLAYAACDDLDGDGRPDLIATNQGNEDLYTSLAILWNAITPTTTQLCSSVGSTGFTENQTGTNYQWQLNTGSGFFNITNNNNYSGATSNVLQLNNIDSTWYGYQYRCVVDGIAGTAITIQFSDSWLNLWSGMSTAWENSSNWSCGVLPGANTDVIINSGTVVLNSDVSIRSLIVKPGASFTVNANHKLTILH